MGRCTLLTFSTRHLPISYEATVLSTFYIKPGLTTLFFVCLVACHLTPPWQCHLTPPWQHTILNPNPVPESTFFLGTHQASKDTIFWLTYQIDFYFHRCHLLWRYFSLSHYHVSRYCYRSFPTPCTYFHFSIPNDTHHITANTPPTTTKQPEPNTTTRNHLSYQSLPTSHKHFVLTISFQIEPISY